MERAIASVTEDHADGQMREQSLENSSSGNRLTCWTARVVTFLSAVRISIASAPIGVLGALAAAPMWLPSLRHYRGAIVLSIGLLVATAWGAALTVRESPFNGGTSTNNLLENSFLLILILTGSGVLMWSREHLSDRSIGVAVGLGFLLTNILNGTASHSVNPWKFGLAIPVSIIALALVSDSRRWQPTFAALTLLALANVVLDSRAAFAICALAALLFMAQRHWSVRTGASIRARAVSLLLAALAAAAALYQVASHLLMAGYLGEEAQQRSIMQEELSGSMIVGGRPEMAATWALMQHRPAGFGSGAIPSTEDVMVAKSGMWGINYQPDNGYVENYMFGGGFELHSVIGNMWVYFGVVGLLLSLFMAGLLIHALFIRLATGTASGLVIFLTALSLWNILFGPLWGSSRILAITLGLALLRKGQLNSARELVVDFARPRK